ncbi:MAG: CRISPR-associated endonuclease Cas2 [Roseiarcus sp.]
MAREMLMVFAYDVARDRNRARIAALLERELARVQKSVFEGRMTKAAAERLGRRAGLELGPGDSLRIYAVTPVGLKCSQAFGALPMAEPHDYWLV